MSATIAPLPAMSVMSKAIPTLYHIYIYTNEECNLACSHCWITAKLSNQVRNRQVTAEMYRRFIADAIPLGLGYVKISGGEALLSKDEVFSIIRFTHERGIITRIETNGTLIDEEFAKALQETRTFVSVSVDGSTAQLHERMRQVPGCFEATMRGLALLRQYNVPVEIIMSVTKENAHDVPNVAKIAATMKNGRVKINPVLASGRGWQLERKGARLSVPDLFHWSHEIEKKQTSYGVPILMSAEPAFYSLGYMTKGYVSGGRCGFKNLFGILANGKISFCGMGNKAPEYVFGHVSDIDLKAVWTGHPGLTKIREQIPDQLEGICGNCMMKASCQGACRSNAYETYGSITAPSPGCQALYEAGLFPKTRMIDPSRRCDYVPGPGSNPLRLLN